MGCCILKSGVSSLENRRLVTDKLAAAVGQDGREAGQACPLLLAAAYRGASAPTPVWPNAAANLGSAGTHRVARRLRSKNLGLREEGRSSVRKMRLHGRNRGSSDGQDRVVGTPRSRRACSGNKFRRGEAGEVYDVPELSQIGEIPI